MIHSQTSKISRVAVLLLAISPAGIVPKATAGQQSWSVDLREYGVKDGRGEDGRSYHPTVPLAATNNVVAVALAKPAPLTAPNETDNRLSSPWEVTLLFFEASNGKLRTKRGPWPSDFDFELHPTPQGNFLVSLPHFHDSSKKAGETLLLLSSSGEELKRLELAPSIRRSEPHRNEFLVSASGGTVLLGQVLEDGVHYRVMEPDTLDTKLEWMQATGSHSPWIVAISDKEMLGIGAVKKEDKPSAVDSGLYTRTFEGTWAPFPVTLDIGHHGIQPGLHPNHSVFLGDDLIVALFTKPGAAPGVPSPPTETPIKVFRTDGTIASSPTIPKLPDRTWLTGPVATSADGRYFAVGFSHRGWLSHVMLDVMQMDMAFENDESLLFFWEASHPMPVARINLGNKVYSYSLSADDPPLVLAVNGTTLKTIRVQP